MATGNIGAVRNNSLTGKQGNPLTALNQIYGTTMQHS